MVGYLGRFEGDERIDRALTVLRAGVIAIQSVSPTLDTQVVQEKFAEMEQDLREQVVHFVKELAVYLKDKDGVLPRSLEAVFGDHGKLVQHFGRFFDPTEGKLVSLIDSKIGPASPFGKSLDPKNKEGILSLIEKTVREQVDKKLEELLGELSLNEKDSAMYRIHEMLAGKLGEIKEAIGIQKGEEKEAQRGHVKGFSFQEGLYECLAEWGRQQGDETEFVANTPNRGSKHGDHLITLGETSGAPGLRLVVEVKDQPLKCKKAIEELQDAKANREAAIGIFVMPRAVSRPRSATSRGSVTISSAPSTRTPCSPAARSCSSSRPTRLPAQLAFCRRAGTVPVSSTLRRSSRTSMPWSRPCSAWLSWPRRHTWSRSTATTWKRN